jgi:hypothetical protein
MTIVSSTTLRDIVATYTQEYVNRQHLEVIVEPLAGQTIISPQERFTITVRATNDPDFSNPSGANPAGVRLINVRWHIGMINENICDIEVPEPPLDSRASSSANSPLLTPGDLVKEIYIFPRFGKSNLDPGETNEIRLEGVALQTGTITLTFDIIADVDPEFLSLEDQSSFSDTGSAQVVT